MITLKIEHGVLCFHDENMHHVLVYNNLVGVVVKAKIVRSIDFLVVRTKSSVIEREKRVLSLDSDHLAFVCLSVCLGLSLIHI